MIPKPTLWLCSPRAPGRKAAGAIQRLSQLLVESDFGFEPAEMLLLVCEDLLDKISRGGIMSRRGGLGGCIELRASMALQSQVVVENLAHGCTDGERLDRECGCAAEIDEPIKECADRYRLIGGPHSHCIGEALQAPCLDHCDMSLMLNAASPEATQQPVQDREYWVVSHCRVWPKSLLAISATWRPW